MVKCQSCGAENPPDNNFCEFCGVKLMAPPSGPIVEPPQVGLECPQCKNVNPSDSVFCENCGFNLQEVVVPPTPPPSPIATLIMPDSSEMTVTGREIIGRAQLARYAAPTEASWISREHFIITQDGGRFFIEDQKSLNGTKLNDVEIKGKGRQELKDGDQILVADVVNLKFKAS